MFFLLYLKIINYIEIYNLFILFISNFILVNSILCFFMKNPMYTLLLLIINYSLAGFLFFFNGIEFLSFVFILIYVGAVSILILFVLMLLNIKIIFYKQYSLKTFNYFILFILFLELFLFFYFFLNNKIFIFDEEIYTNWFFILETKKEINILGLEIFVFNYDLLIIISFFLLMVLISSVSIVNSVKFSKKQKFFLQYKNYNKNIILK